MHGLTDYAFGLALMTVPALINADRKTVKYYQMMAAQIFLYSAVTKQPYALAPLIPLPILKKIDIGNLVGLTLFAANPGVHRRKNLLAFHIGMTALGLINVLLTNWKNHK